MAAPPVARFLDFGQYKYELTKREKDAKRRQRAVSFKEVRLSPKIGVGDFETKKHRAVEFLSDGDRLKVTVRFRGRELTHPEIGRALLERFAEQIKEHGIVERAPVLEGKSMFLTMASTHKPKVVDAPAHAADEPAAEAAGVVTEPRPQAGAKPASQAEAKPASQAEAQPKPPAPRPPQPATPPAAAGAQES